MSVRSGGAIFQESLRPAFSRAVAGGHSAWPIPRYGGRRKLTLPDYGQLASVAAYLFFLKEVFGGIFRFVTVHTGLLFLNYVPPFLTILAIAIFYVQVFRVARIHYLMVCFTFLAAVFVAYAFVNEIPALQSTVGFYIWLPFIAGLLLSLQHNERVLFKSMLALWCIAVVGVLINSVVDFPWAGASYEVLGVPREIARKWSYLGFDRIAGFGRASFAAAYMILFYSCCILVSQKYSLVIRWGSYLFTGYALFLTTSKSPILIWAIIPIFLSVYETAGALLGRQSLVPFYWAKSSIIFLLVLLIGLPLWGNIPDIAQNRLQIYFFTFTSLTDRMQITWPDAFALLAHGGNMLLGRGVGGIGTPQQFYETDLYNYADNLFVYLYVSTGLVGVIAIFSALIANLKATFISNRQKFKETYILLFYLLGLGISVNVIDGPVQALLLGALVGRGLTESPLRKSVKASVALASNVRRHCAIAA
jgi:O-antigen ligase/polysaccharide polymerase Wzy-like membrane protein